MNYIMILAIIGAFWLGVGLLDRKISLSRFNLDFQGIGILWRTETFNGFIDSISQKAKPVWDVLAWVGVVFSSAGILYVFYYMARMAYRIAASPKTSSAGAQVLIPGITVPFWYSLIGLIILIFVHELAHGIIARLEKIKLKSVGLGLFLVLPLAFVEPDEEELKAARRSSRLKLYAAGSFANFIVYLIAIFLLSSYVTGAFEETQMKDGVLITGVMKDMPAYTILKKEMVIHAINGMPAKSMDEFTQAMLRFKPNDTITISTDSGDFSVTLTSNPEDRQKGFIGINIAQHYSTKEGTKGSILSIVYNSLWWIALLNLGIGLMNLLPITFILDGGKMVKEFLEMILPVRTAGFITTAMGIFCILLLIINLLPGIF